MLFAGGGVQPHLGEGTVRKPGHPEVPLDNDNHAPALAAPSTEILAGMLGLAPGVGCACRGARQAPIRLCTWPSATSASGI